MEILVLSLLILLNGFFALSEIALVSSKPSRLEQMKKAGNKGALKALQLQKNSEVFLSAIQVGITLIGIVTGVYGGLNIADDVAPFFREIAITAPYAQQIALTLTVLVITYVSIVIGELVPKTIAINNPERIAARVAPVVHYFSILFYPFVKLLSISTTFINRLLGIQKSASNITEAELRHMIKTASLEGVIEEEQNIIHEKLFYFADKKAKHIMTHRSEIEWIDLQESPEEIHKFLTDVEHSKIVCCDGDIDDFVGFLYLRDYYKQLAANNTINIRDLIAEPLIVPENADAKNVLALFRKRKNHICCVVNEYGGFEGIISLHDIFENIVGHLPDERDSDEPDVFMREDHSYLINGDAPIETLTEIIPDFTVDFEEIDYATMAGFVYNQVEKIPQVGDKIEVMGYTIEVVDMDGMKIDKLLVSKKS